MLRISAFSRLQRGKYVKVSPHSRYYKKRWKKSYIVFLYVFFFLRLLHLQRLACILEIANAQYLVILKKVHFHISICFQSIKLVIVMTLKLPKTKSQVCCKLNDSSFVKFNGSG